MGKFGALIVLSIIGVSPAAFGDFGNYNSVLLGDRAAGMGGAFTALTGDPASCSFYNPASLSQIQGTSFAANATLYNKYDTSFSDQGNLSESTLKLNRGSFQPIPAAAGSAIGYGTFAIGVSILTPDFETYSGDISLNTYPNSTTFVNAKDQSLWVGGNMAINFTDNFSAGITIYYTSRDFQRATTQQTTVGGNSKFSYESKAYTSNNAVYVLGGLYKFDSRWSLGASYRFKSIQLSGDGSYYVSVLDTSVSGVPVNTSRKNIQSFTHIPEKLALGVSYEIPKVFAMDFDVSYYGADSFEDMLDPVAAETVSYQQILNYAIGAEYYWRSWMALRGGLFTNFSSHPGLTGNGNREADHIDMLGFSANVGLFSGQTSFTIGGYFTGGRGQSTQAVNEQIVVTPKVNYIYALLVGSSYHF